ncbi:MAG: sigma factor-like helix-turn-helix DNA-binding protein [Vicinamibacteria bacterium]
MTCFVLREVEGLNTAEAAECLGVSEDVIKTRLHRARSLLRTELFERAGLASAEIFRFHLSRCDRVVSAVFARLNLPPPHMPHCDCPGDFCQKRGIEHDPRR